MRNRVLYILLGIGVVLVLVYPKIKKRVDRENFQKYLDSLPTYAMDLSTPQGAILCLEDAYQRKDIEAAVACKDFTLEAMLMSEDKDPNVFDEEVIDKLAETLELAFREGIEDSWPDFEGLKSYFDSQEPYQENVVIVTEVCRYPDGGYSRQRILVGKTENEWKVLYPLD